MRAFGMALQLGADGVLVSGCHFGDCHYIFGNYKAVEQFEKTKALVKTLGMEDERIRLEWVSAAEGSRWGFAAGRLAQVGEAATPKAQNVKRTPTFQVVILPNS